MSAIIRADHDADHPFIKVSTDTVRDKSLSFEARGFLNFLLAKPDEWRIRPKQLAEECGVHFTVIYRLLRVLIKAGYAERTDIIRNNGGRYQSGAIYTIREKKVCRRLDNVPF